MIGIFIEEKITLINEIHDICSQLESYPESLSSFLAFLYPAITQGAKCELFGDSDDDLVLLLYLKNNFPKDHKIWNYIQLENENWFTLDATIYTEWDAGWEYILHTHCYYNIVTNECYDVESDIFNGRGELVKQWVEFEIPDNKLFEHDDVFRVDHPIVLRDSNE